MKKLIAVILLAVLAFSLASCGDNGTMSHSDYVAAEIDSEVVVDVYVQATQSWWDNKITVYAADKDGAYFIYELACTEENAKKLTPGTKIRVTGTKGEWAGEVEIMNATFEFAGNSTYTSKATDVTSLIGKDGLIDHQNERIAVKGATVIAYTEGGSAISYKGDVRGDDVYFKVQVNGTTLELCIEAYLTGPDTDVYKAVEALKVGDVIDVEGFLYWYNGANPHVISVTKSN